MRWCVIGRLLKEELNIVWEEGFRDLGVIKECKCWCHAIAQHGQWSEQLNFNLWPDEA